ncbi:MAG: LamG domain-containing protein, partial [Pirellulaceae bacterium]
MVRLGLSFLLILSGVAFAEERDAGTADVAPRETDKSLIAHWTFDEKGGTPKVHNVSGHEGLDSEADRNLPRKRGVHGGALDLSSPHRMPVHIGLVTSDLERITFSAWTQPTNLSGYREIFRQECPTRLLFSYQLHGAILSLGLNIDGYVECDAAIQPGQVLDGQWHHCAATYDGQVMRVYLDGKEIGSLERPGAIATQPEVPAFIGSSGGTGEFFEGGLDDLRIYGEALTADDINGLYRAGLDSLATLSKELEEQLGAFYGSGESFAEVLANSRRNIAERGLRVDRDVAAALAVRLKSRYGEDYDAFVTLTGSSPIDYLIAADDQFHVRQAEHLVGLLTEYKPITACQLENMTVEEH